MKLTWDLLCNCRNSFVKPTLTSDFISPEISLMTKFHKFYHSLLNSPLREVQVILRFSSHDKKSTIGSNLDVLKRETSLDPREFGTKRIKEELILYHSVYAANIDVWRIKYLDKLLSARTSAYYLGDTDNYDDLNNLIHSLVIN